MSVSDDIARDQAEALRTIKRVAESLPGYQETGFDMSGKLNEADLPEAVNFEQVLTPNRPS